MTNPASSTMTPREIVQELDRHIIGQQSAKRAVAIALRNRWRRAQLPEELRNEVMPKNILMIGPTGVGKTEIARRLATLANAPFVKVEATRFTEVGYVGKDVEQIIRDLADTAVKLYREQAKQKMRTQAEERAEDRILDALLPKRDQPQAPFGFGPAAGQGSTTVDIGAEPSSRESETRQKLRRQLRAGDLDDREIEAELKKIIDEQFGGENTFNAAVIVPISESQQLVASYGEGFRAPTFNDLYTTFGANPFLQPEQSKTYEIQWRAEGENSELQVAGFRTDIDDMILLDPFFVAQNISRARIHGLEASFGYEFMGWDTLMSAAWLDPRERGTGNQLPRRPKRTFSLDADRQLGQFGVGFSVIANSERFNDPENQQRLPGFGTLELRSNWRATPNLRLDAKISNVLERDYALANYNTDGRTYAYQEEGLNARLAMIWTPDI